MTIHIIIILILITLFTIGLIYLSTYNTLQDYIIKINEVESKIDDSLREKFDTILKLNNIIKDKIKTNKILVDNLKELKDKDISSFDMDRKLVEELNKVIYVKDKFSELDNDEDIIKLLYSIEDLDESLSAFKKFYNETITAYNVLIRKMPYNIVGKILKYKEKTFFDGKDMSDDKIDDFKL